MTWTTVKPTKPGWYWWRRPYGKRVIETIVKVKPWRIGETGLVVYACKPVERCAGEWSSEPLEPPKETP